MSSIDDRINQQRAWDALVGSGIAGNIFLYEFVLLPLYKLLFKRGAA